MSSSVYSNIVINLLIDCIAEKRRGKIKEISKMIKMRKRNRVHLTKYLRDTIPKVFGYYELIEKYPCDVFAAHFRMKRSTFERLIKICGNTNTWSANIDIDKALLLTIWKLANQETFRGLSDRFNVSKSSAYHIVIATCKFISKNSKLFTKWPTCEEFEIIVKKFNILRGRRSFPSVIGCVDGTHIPILAPKEDRVSYYNRKGEHSMILQGICDSEFKFIDIFFGWPGCHHDSNVWANSPVGKAFAEKEIYIPSSYHIIGDSAYKLFPYLMVGYRDNGFLTEQQKKFNKRLSSSRVVIEQAFRILKSKFRILKYIEMTKISDIKFIVMTCISLHNHIIAHETLDITPDILEDGLESGDWSETVGESGLDVSEEAKLKRDEILQLINI